MHFFQQLIPSTLSILIDLHTKKCRLIVKMEQTVEKKVQQSQHKSLHCEADKLEVAASIGAQPRAE